MSSAVNKISNLRKLASVALLGVGCSCIFFLDRVDIVMNASHSLDDPAYLMLEHPVMLHQGAVVAAKMPDVLKDKFDGYQFVKTIGGIPGDEIYHDEDGSPCIKDYACFPLFLKDGAPISLSIKAGVIPDKHYAVFGTSQDSLDSRYAVIGLLHEDDLVGRGFAVSWAPDWRD